MEQRSATPPLRGRSLKRSTPPRSRRRPASTSSSSSSNSSDGKSKKIRKLEKRLKLIESRPRLVSHPGDDKMIPLFDPHGTNIAVDVWVHRVDELAETYQWDNLTTVRLASNRLGGMARRWYDSQDHLTADWMSIKEKLIKQFSKPLPFSKLLKEAALYETHTGQDLSEYCFNKLDKLRALKLTIPELYLVDAVIGGISDENIARSARASRFTNTNELYSYLSTLGCMPSTSTGEIVKKTINTSVQQRSVRNTDANMKPRMQCYNCKGPHRARDCKKPRLECFNCKRLGHIAKRCPQKNMTQHNPQTRRQEEKEVGETTIVAKAKTSPENPYIMNVILNGKRFKCLVDTGSACTIIRQGVATKLGLEPAGIKSVLRSFSGHCVSSAGVINVNVRIGQPCATIQAVVVDDDFIIHDCIIGRDFLNLPDVMLLKIGAEVRVCKLGNMKEICELECSDIRQVERQLTLGESITEEDKVKCQELMAEFKDRISNSMATIGKTDAAKLEIKLVTQEPIACSPYRMPLVEKRILRDIIGDLLVNGIIRESTSSYASPILLVKKKTGDYRMCVDYRRLNAITVKDKYPLPLIDDQLDRLGGNEDGRRYKYFTVLDLFSGFYQVPVDQDSVDKTAFVTPDGHYEFLRMPFGLCNSPSVFQRLMTNVLGSLKNSVAFSYMDDVIIPSTTIAEGLQRLRLVLEALRKHNLTLKITKCSFFSTKIEYLGREISEEGIKPGQAKIEAILKMIVPNTVKQVRQFLGLAGYFRKFVKNYSKVVTPLTQLTRKDSKWCWGAEQEAAFETIKRVLTTRPVLAIFDPTLPTELHTDASSMAVGAILLQLHDGVQRVVAYFSKQTTMEQRQYHSYELETMAVVYALHHFRVYLLGLHFTVVSDCNALRTTFAKRDLIPRVGRWWLQVQEFTFDIKYRPGSRMPHVDALSRYPVMVEVDQVDITEGDWILSAQLQDDKLARVHKILLARVENSETKQYFQKYELKQGKVYRKMPKGKSVWAVPHAARWQIVRLCHDQVGHLSIEHTLRRIQMNYYFPKMRRFVTKYIRACLNCAYYKNCPGKKQGKLHPIEKVSVPFHTVHLDHVGPFETSRSGNKYLLVIVDGFTKFTIIEAVKSTKVRPVIKTLQRVMCIFGVPVRIISDRGSAFTSQAFRLFCETYAIRHVLNAVATPRGNGQCERYNKTIVSMLATTCVNDEGNLWDTQVKELQSAMNTSFNKSINSTPVQALFGYQARPMAEATLLNSVNDVADRIDLKKLRSRIKEHIDDDQRKQKERYDRNRRNAERYEVGDLVLVQITGEASTGLSKKLLPKFKGPFRVVKVLFNDRYEVEDLRERRHNQRTVVAVDRVKRWIALQR